MAKNQKKKSRRPPSIAKTYEKQNDRARKETNDKTKTNGENNKGPTSEHKNTNAVNSIMEKIYKNHEP